jgi:hypothetical protein
MLSFTAFAEERSPAAIAESCGADGDCIPGAECNAEGFCRCVPGSVGCGDTHCADLASDPDNCGGCSVRCADGEACVAGECTDGDGLSTVSQAISIATPVHVVNGGTPQSTTSCVNEGEVVVTRVSGNHDTDYFAAFGDDYSIGTAWNVWSAAMDIDSSADVNHGAMGDAWSTYSIINDRVYAAAISDPTGTEPSCLGVAGGDSDEIDTDLWDYPSDCADPTDNCDQPSIVFDDALRTLFAAYKHSGIQLDFHKNCTTSPGYAGCARNASVLVDPPDGLEYTIDVNPCSNHVVLAYRNGSDVRLRFYDRDGVQHGASGGFLVAGWQTWNGAGNNAGCTTHTIRRCGLGTSDCKGSTSQDNGQCMRDNARVSVAVKLNPNDNRCYAAMAWDFKATGGDGTWYVKNRYYVVDITNESAPVVKKNWLSTSTSNNWNQYYSYVVLNDYTNNVGWFWASDGQGACNVHWVGAVDTNLGLTNMSSTGSYSGAFPAITFSSFSGIGDYSTGVKRGPSGGYLMPVWPQPVPTSASCRSCQGVQYSNAAKLTRILP